MQGTDNYKANARCSFLSAILFGILLIPSLLLTIFSGLEVQEKKMGTIFFLQFLLSALVSVLLGICFLASILHTATNLGHMLHAEEEILTFHEYEICQHDEV